MSHAIIPATGREGRDLTEDVVRRSVGIEDVNDLIADLDTAPRIELSLCKFLQDRQYISSCDQAFGRYGGLVMPLLEALTLDCFSRSHGVHLLSSNAHEPICLKDTCLCQDIPAFFLFILIRFSSF